MEIKVSTENRRVPVTVIHADGNIDSSTAGAFQKKVDELINGGARYILIDLSHVSFVSSAGLRVIHSIFNQLRMLHPIQILVKMKFMRVFEAGLINRPT